MGGVRIVGGELSGRRIDAPRGATTRPTSDKVRQAIFNRVAHAAFAAPEPDGGRLGGPVLDLYAGSGALGLEALSRGAPRCDFVDSGQEACAAIRANLAALGLEARAGVIAATAEAFLRGRPRPYRLVFADPPYADAAALTRALARLAGGWLEPDALVIVEHEAHAAPRPDGLVLIDERRYGQTAIGFFASATRVISEGA